MSTRLLEERRYFITDSTLLQKIEDLVESGELVLAGSSIPSNLPSGTLIFTNDLSAVAAEPRVTGCTVEIVSDGVVKITWLTPFADSGYTFRAWGQTSAGTEIALDKIGIPDDNTKTTDDVLVYCPAGTKYLTWLAVT